MNELSLMNDIFNPEAVDNLPTRNKLAIRRDGGQAIATAMVSVIHEQGRAALTNTALENIGALSALEEHLCQVAPCGSERYRHIVNAYTVGAVKKIARW